MPIQLENRAEAMRQMVLFGAAIQRRYIKLSEFQEQIVQAFPDLQDESRVDDIVKYIYDRSTELRNGRTGFPIGDEFISISKKTLRNYIKSKNINAGKAYARPSLTSLIVPILVMLILIILLSTRWSVDATKTSDFTVLEWKRDRWTGQVWVNRYNPHLYVERPVNKYTDDAVQRAWDNRNDVFSYWLFFAVADSAWLIIAFYKYKKRENNGMAI